jgi:predicted transcriptional regulator
MNTQATDTMTIRLPSDTKDKLALLAVQTRRSKSFLAAEAVSAYVEREWAIVEGIKQGLSEIKAGQVIAHDKAMQRISESITKTAKR